MHQAYKKARNDVAKKVKDAKAKHFIHCFEKTTNNPQEMWKTINKLINKKSKTTTISEIKTENGSFTDPKEITNILNEYFCNIGYNLAQNLESTSVQPSSYVDQRETEFKLDPVTEAEVYKYLSNVKPTKSTGYDKIPPKLIKDAAGVISRSLTIIFNKSIISGIFPEDLKIAVLSPIFKKGDRSSCGNYRPISVLSVIAKILEKIAFDQLCKYFDNNNIISNEQSGFRKNYSTETSLLAVTNRWYCNMDKGLLNGVLFLDLKKAFDCVDHQILLNKLAMYGVCDLTLKWFESYLSNRKQTCKVNNIFSEMRQTKTGVPRGSNLGPLLFLTYVNDLPNCSGNASASMFADDTNITATGQTVQELQTNLNNNLEKVHHWLLANKLTLSYNKTEYMIIGSRQKILNIQEEPLISIGNETIKKISKCKTLGVIIDDKLLWKDHINEISAKVSKGLGIMRRIKTFVTQSVMQSIYNSLILPYFDYCNMVWENTAKYNLQKVQKMQNRAARILTGSSYDVPTTDLMRQLKWQTLEDRRDHKKALLMHKVKNGTAPDLIKNLFNICDNQNYSLRSNLNNFKLDKPKRNFMKKALVTPVQNFGMILKMILRGRQRTTRFKSYCWGCRVVLHV